MKLPDTVNDGDREPDQADANADSVSRAEDEIAVAHTPKPVPNSGRYSRAWRKGADGLGNVGPGSSADGVLNGVLRNSELGGEVHRSRTASVEGSDVDDVALCEQGRVISRALEASTPRHHVARVLRGCSRDEVRHPNACRLIAGMSKQARHLAVLKRIGYAVGGERSSSELELAVPESVERALEDPASLGLLYPRPKANTRIGAAGNPGAPAHRLHRARGVQLVVVRGAKARLANENPVPVTTLERAAPSRSPARDVGGLPYGVKATSRFQLSVMRRTKSLRPVWTPAAVELAEVHSDFAVYAHDFTKSTSSRQDRTKTVNAKETRTNHV